MQHIDPPAQKQPVGIRVDSFRSLNMTFLVIFPLKRGTWFGSANAVAAMKGIQTEIFERCIFIGKFFNAWTRSTRVGWWYNHGYYFETCIS